MARLLRGFCRSYSSRVLSSWSLAAILMVALLVHEYGHYVVARRLGIKVSGPYFIAALGAFVKLDQDMKLRRDETYLALARPFAGSIMTLAFAMGFALTQSPYLAVIAFIAGVVNILQMVPMLPLDGGRALWGVVFSIHPYLGIAVSAVIILTPVAFAVLGSPIIFLIFVPFMIPEIVWQIKAVRRHKPLQVPMSKRDILLSSLACVAITVGLGVMIAVRCLERRWHQRARHPRTLLEEDNGLRHYNKSHRKRWFSTSAAGLLHAWTLPTRIAVCMITRLYLLLMADNLLVLDKLSKRYAGTRLLALDSISLHVAPGEVYGFLGANGAGKSTTIRTLLNFIQPTSGTATICGNDIVKNSVAVKRHAGYLAGEIALYDRMTGKEFLSYMAALQPLKTKGYTAELVKRFEADTRKPLGTLSKGNRQKFGLIQAVMHEPDVLILDEPTSGLDPLMQEEFFKLMHESKERGAAVFVSSHNFAEVQRMCDRIGFIREGKLVAEQTLAALANRAAHTFTLTFTDTVPLRELRTLSHAHVTSHDEHRVTISLEGELTPFFVILAKHHVVRLEQQEVNLEEEFMRLYKPTGETNA